jgi:TPP-dependent pyruvate/acetoin dehydrogenase alpha subunit
MDKQELIDFEKEVKQMYLDGKLRSPVHLSGGNEDELIEIFKEIKPNDWVFTTYRSHYHALLKGVPKDRLRNWILDNKSIHFMDNEYKVFSSAIVGGCVPIALGTAMAIKLKEVYMPDRSNEPRVFIFVGDMTASTGVFKDCLDYAINFKLPITFVIENNGLSTDTNTGEAWGTHNDYIDNDYKATEFCHPDYIKYYRYTRTYPHYGVGEFVDFKDESLKQDGKSF